MVGSSAVGISEEVGGSSLVSASGIAPERCVTEYEGVQGDSSLTSLVTSGFG